MPTYTYRCPICREVTEEARPIAWRNESRPACPTDRVEMNRVITAPAVQFVGPGFYRTGG